MENTLVHAANTPAAPTSTLEPITANPTGDAGQSDALAEQRKSQLLEQLVDRWLRHGKADLQIRYTTGKELNTQFGEPGSRQDRGGKVLKEAAEKMQVAESEISRMRWFATLFTSVENFQQLHPEVQTWTAIKDKIVVLKRTYEFQEQYKHTLDNLASQFEKLRKDLTPAVKADLLQNVRGFMTAVSGQSENGSDVGSANVGSALPDSTPSPTPNLQTSA